jgi:hypothetical protein
MIHGLSLTVGKWIEGVVSCGLLDFLLCSVGDLNPLSGVYFPLFSMVFPWEISISVETCGSERKQKCGKAYESALKVAFVKDSPELRSLASLLILACYSAEQINVIFCTFE